MPASSEPPPPPPGSRARRLARALRDAWQQWDDDRPPYRVTGYRGYATPGGDGAAPKVLVLARAHSQAAVPPPDAAHSPWQNLRSALARITHDPLPHARVRATVGGRTHPLVADDEGFVHAWLPLDRPLAPGQWHDVGFALDAPGPAAAAVAPPLGTLPVGSADPAPGSVGGAPTPARVLAPAATARFGVVSDLDDTVLQSEVGRFAAAARLVLFENARTRLPFPGVAAFYRALAAGGSGADDNPVFYLSSSPWNLYDVIADFLDARGLPTGPVLLRDWDLGRELARTTTFKNARLAELFDAYPTLPFVLVGDSSQSDPEIYAAAAAAHPGRVRAVYIRDVTNRPDRRAAIARLAETLAATSVPLVLDDTTLGAARHAASAGFIRPETLAAVEADKEADEHGATPGP